MGAFQPMHLFVLAIAGIVMLFAAALVARLAIPLVRAVAARELDQPGDATSAAKQGLRGPPTK